MKKMILIISTILLLFSCSTPEERLIKAVETNNIRKIKRLIDDGLNVDMSIDSDWTLLMLAASIGNTETIESLLSLGADVNYKKRKNYTALRSAHANEQKAAVLTLLNSGAIDYNLTTLKWACRRNPDIILHILDNQKELLTSQHLFDALNYADTPQIQTILLNAGAKINYQNKDGNTVLMMTSGYKRFNSLLNSGANPNIQNKEGWTALMIKALQPDSKYYELLLSAGANINETNNMGETALMIAAKNRYLGDGDIDSFKIL